MSASQQQPYLMKNRVTLILDSANNECQTYPAAACNPARRLGPLVWGLQKLKSSILPG